VSGAEAGTTTFSTDEVMIVNAARQLGALAAAGHPVCFVGIGLPSTAANLARRLYDPAPVLVYESGCIGSKPTTLPLSIGDGELAETADAVVSVPEIFAYWLQAGRIDVGFLGGAQLDRYGNINSTVIGDYRSPRTRLPGAGGAPEIAASAGAVMVIMRQSKRAFVERCDFRTSIGFGDGPGQRERLGLRGGGVRWVITDLGVLEPDPTTCLLTVRALHPGVTREQVVDATGWAVEFADDVTETAPPTDAELSTLRALQAA
jgi:glutaconate CoA-transferase subunit B